MYIDVVGRRNAFLGFSALLILVGMIALAIPPHLNLGIDFTSGSTFDLNFTKDPGIAAVRTALADANYPDAIVQGAGGGDYLIRTPDLGENGLDAIKAIVTKEIGSDFTVPSVSSTSPSVAKNTVRDAITAVGVGAIFVMLYIAYAFRTVPKSYRYALAAIIALMHDVLVVLGLFAVLGRVIDAQVNAIFIVAILTVVGYSVNDTIVVFDRIRENVRLMPSRQFRTTVNISVTETMTRSLLTSFTTALAVLAMLLFGGASLRDFLIALLSGIIIGTYSSIFIAAQILVLWEEGAFERFKFWRRWTAPQAEQAT